MKKWIEYEGHEVIKTGKREQYDNTIFTFDIETTSFLSLHNKQIEACNYLNLNQSQKDDSIPMGIMYIWMFSINDVVYYGRTWREFRLFLERLFYFGTDIKKYVFVHNLSWEFQFMRNEFRFKNVFSRKSRKVIKCELEDYNLEFRCSYYMSSVKLERLPDIYNLDVKKLVGNLDYTKIRHNKTELTEQEKEYCKNDCLVVYKYIQMLLEKYKTIKKIPITATGFVRKEFRELVEKNYIYKRKVGKCINIDGHIFNILTSAFARWLHTFKLDENQ